MGVLEWLMRGTWSESGVYNKNGSANKKYNTTQMSGGVSEHRGAAGSKPVQNKGVMLANNMGAQRKKKQQQEQNKLMGCRDKKKGVWKSKVGCRRRNWSDT